jgi:hypothetical protein
MSGNGAIKALSVSGLVLSTASAFWLLMREIWERNRNAHHLLKKQEFAIRRDALKNSLAGVQRDLASANKSLDPSGVHERYSIEDMTKDVRKQIEVVDEHLSLADDLGRAVDEAWPTPSHLGAFMLLFIGFVCQLVAELLKP